MNNFHPMDRPVLVIKEKHKFEGQGPSGVVNNNDKDEYFKVSGNTNVVDNIGEEIKFLESMIRRKTKVHGGADNKINEPDTITSVYKVEGIEFLPEGFIELDPLLLKDEYEFESAVHEKLFTEEQKKTKALRRKQYQLRDK